MKNLIIIGARGFGREIYNLATQTKEYNTEWTIKGFLDDKANVLDNFNGYPPILSSVENYEVQENDLFICALGDVYYKKKYTNLILLKRGIFTNIIHPTAITNSHNTKIGVGVIIGPFTYIGNDAEIGNFTTIQSHSAVGHDVKIGDYCQVNALTFFGGFVDVGEESTINPSATITPKKKIGNNAVVGINSTVLRDVKSMTTVFGTPAKELF
jgi:sugar O-acyltransferase (sialic acid O-acetyltransferase NeuD family)